jgi:hypothetical protein
MWQLLFVNGCDWKNQISAEKKYYTRASMGQKHRRSLDCAENDGNQKEQRATRTAPDLLTFFVISHKYLQMQTENVVVLTSFFVQHRQVRVPPCSLAQSPWTSFSAWKVWPHYSAHHPAVFYDRMSPCFWIFSSIRPSDQRSLPQRRHF